MVQNTESIIFLYFLISFLWFVILKTVPDICIFTIIIVYLSIYSGWTSFFLHYIFVDYIQIQIITNKYSESNLNSEHTFQKDTPGDPTDDQICVCLICHYVIDYIFWDLSVDYKITLRVISLLHTIVVIFSFMQLLSLLHIWRNLIKTRWERQSQRTNENNKLTSIKLYLCH